MLMGSFNRSPGFLYNPNSRTIDEGEFSGILEIYVHHARNIPNICIYDKQDVYAKFSLTYAPDETLSTRIINGGGKNPKFNQKLIMKISQLDSVLKCEIWVLSRARHYMEDQLLGFALIPVSELVGNEKVTRDYSLSSTDLFHSPAGTVQLTLFVNPSSPVRSSNSSSISSEVVLLDRKISEDVLDPIGYSDIQFPDINMVNENQKMASEYFDLAGPGSCTRRGSMGIVTFLQMGASPQPVDDDYEMTQNSPVENIGGSFSQNSGFLSSTTSVSDDRNSADSVEKKNRVDGETYNSHNANQSTGSYSHSPTSKKGSEIREEKELNEVFSHANMEAEAEESAMQKQIVDMYMRSMQQFTESLAKMKLPMDLDKPQSEDSGDVIDRHKSKSEVDKNKKDGSRVFYGSRAFF